LQFTYGWKRDGLDRRDHPLTFAAPVTRPAKVSLRGKIPFVYDQLDLGSCTANAAAATYRYELAKQGLPDFHPSRLKVYYDERVIEHSVWADAGAQIRDAAKVLGAGVCSEEAWPYDVSQFAKKPPKACYDESKKHLALAYERVPQTVEAVESCLAAGFAVMIGFMCFESLESDAVLKTGHIPFPKPDEKQIGGHAVMLGGYDTTVYPKVVELLNSWGPQVGDKGWFTLPYDYVFNPQLAADFWTVKLVSQ
jgi:C1A family cysteine protease